MEGIRSDDTIYLTGIGEGEVRIRELSKELSIPLWPSDIQPIVTLDLLLRGFPPKLIIGVPRGTSQEEIEQYTSTSVKYFIDTILPTSRIRRFIDEVSIDDCKQEMTFLLSNETVYYKDAAKTFVNSLIRRGIFNKEAKDVIRISLHEAMVNALIHGNLELGSKNRNTAYNLEKYFLEVENRIKANSYKARGIEIITTWDDKSLKIRIINDGDGFQESVLSTFPDMASKSGKGLFLIAMIADSCVIEGNGREISISFELDENTKEQVFVDKYKLQGSEIRDIGGRFKNSRVLIIDEDFSKQKVTESLLFLMGVETIYKVNNIKEALEIKEDIRPHVIIIDVTSKNYDQLRLLKDSKQFKDIPILVETGNNSREQRDRIFPFGATDFITKPFNPLEFFTRVKVHLENRILAEKTIEQLNRLENELNYAQQMQLELFPTSKKIKEISNKYDLFIKHYFNSSSELGGDIWGVEDIGDKVAFYTCDFSGHGVSAAINTFRLHTILEQHPIIEYSKPSEYLTMLNSKLLSLLPRGQFATFFLGIIDFSSSILEYSVSASPRPFIGDKGGVKVISGSGLPLGISSRARYDDLRVSFNRGDFIFVYSDGLSECRSKEEGEILGEEGLLGIVNSNVNKKGFEEDFNNIVDSVFKFSVNPPSDDMSAFMIKRR